MGTTAVLGELNDAHGRLKSASDWNDGGLAEVTDAMWMHRNQRCTTMVNSKSNRVEKCSKQLYLRVQLSSIYRSRNPMLVGGLTYASCKTPIPCLTHLGLVHTGCCILAQHLYR